MIVFWYLRSGPKPYVCEMMFWTPVSKAWPAFTSAPSAAATASCALAPCGISEGENCEEKDTDSLASAIALWGSEVREAFDCSRSDLACTRGVFSEYWMNKPYPAGEEMGLICRSVRVYEEIRALYSGRASRGLSALIMIFVPPLRSIPCFTVGNTKMRKRNMTSRLAGTIIY